jgi:spore coat protein U-like protein
MLAGTRHTPAGSSPSAALRLFRKFCCLALSVSGAAISLAPPVRAGDAAYVQVTATVLAKCQIQSVRDLAFGTLDPSQPVDAQARGEVTFACTRGVEWHLTADMGLHFDPASGKRRMQGRGDSYLPYFLEGGAFTGSGLGFGDPLALPLVAHIAGPDYVNLAADDYSDTIRLTLEP